MFYPRLWPLFLAFVAFAAAVAARADDRQMELEMQALRLFSEAQMLEESHQYPEALKLYEAASQVMDDSPTLFLNMARCSFSLPDYKKARRYAERAAELDDTNAEARFLGGSAVYRMGEVQQAIDLLHEAVALDSMSVLYSETLAAIYESEGEVEEAIAVLDDLRRRRPVQVSLLYKLGTLELQQNDPEAALQYLELAVEQDRDFPGLMTRLAAAYDMAGRSDEAAEAYREALVQQPSNLGARKRLVDMLTVTGRLDEALREARTLRYMAPTDPEVLQRVSTIAYGAGEFDEAMESLERLEAQGALGPDLLTMKAEILLRTGAEDEALDAVESALQMDDENLRSLLLAAQLEVRQGSPERARDYLERARELRPDSHEIQMTLALVLSEGEEYEEALSVLDGLAERDPDNIEIQFSRGVALERLQRRDEAVAVLETVIERNPHHASAMNYLGYMWAEQGENLEEAHDLITRALVEEPGNPAFLDSLGWVLFKMGRIDEGCRALAEAADRVADPVILEHLGDCLLAQGDAEGALSRFQAARAEGGEGELEAKIQRARAMLGEQSAEPQDHDGVESVEEANP